MEPKADLLLLTIRSLGDLCQCAVALGDGGNYEDFSFR